MEVLTHILSGIVVGFIGFLPIGMINLTVADSAVREGFGNALQVALGASVIGFLQALVSVECSSYIMMNPDIERILNWASIPVLIGSGFYFLYGKRDKTTSELKKRSSRGIVKGMIVSTMNVIAIPYWLFYSVYLAGTGLIDLSTNLLIVLMSLGGGIGMFLAFYLYAYLGVFAKKKVNMFKQNTNKAISVVMFLLGAIQIYRVLS